MTRPGPQVSGDTAGATLTPASAPASLLLVEDLFKRFGPLEVLRDVSLTAREHQVISVIGASGSGKSTLLRCINLLELPDAGRSGSVSFSRRT